MNYKHLIAYLGQSKSQPGSGGWTENIAGWDAERVVEIYGNDLFDNKIVPIRDRKAITVKKLVSVRTEGSSINVSLYDKQVTNVTHRAYAAIHKSSGCLLAISDNASAAIGDIDKLKAKVEELLANGKFSNYAVRLGSKFLSMPMSKFYEL